MAKRTARIKAAQRSVIRAALRVVNADGIAVAPGYLIGNPPTVQRPRQMRTLENAIARLKEAMSRKRRSAR